MLDLTIKFNQNRNYGSRVICTIIEFKLGPHFVRSKISECEWGTLQGELIRILFNPELHFTYPRLLSEKSTPKLRADSRSISWLKADFSRGFLTSWGQDSRLLASFSRRPERRIMTVIYRFLFTVSKNRTSEKDTSQFKILCMLEKFC